MAKAPQINVEAFNQLQERVNRLYNSLQGLDDLINEKVIKRFELLARGTNQFVNAFDKLETTLKGIDLSTSVKQIANMFTAIQTLDKELSQAAGGLDTSPLAKFSNAFYRLLLSFENINNINIDQDKLDNLRKGLTSLSALFKNRKFPDNFDDYIKQIRTIGKIKDVFDSLNSIQISDSSALGTLSKFFDQLADLSQKTSKIQFGDSVSAVINDLGKIFRAIATLPSPETDKLVGFAGVADVIKNFLDEVASIATGGSYLAALKIKTVLPQLVGLIEPLLLFIRTVAKSGTNAEAVSAAAQSLEQVLFQVTLFFTAVADFVNNVNYFVFRRLIAILEPITEVFTSLRDIVKSIGARGFGDTKITGLDTLFTNIVDFFRQIIEFSQKATGLGIFNFKFRLVFDRFITIFREVKDIFAILSGSVVDFRAEAGKMIELSRSQSISASAVQAVADIFDNINLLFQKLTTTNFGNGKDFSGLLSSGFLGGIKSFFNGISGLVSGIQGAVKFTVFATFIRTYLGDIKGVLELTKDINPESIRGLGDIFKSLEPILGYMVEFNTVMNAIKGGLNKAAGALTLGRSLDSTINAVKGVLFIAKDVNPATVQGVGEIFKGLSVMYTAYADFARAVNEALAGGVVSAITTLPIRLAAMQLTISVIFRVLRGIIEMTSTLSVEQIKAIGVFTKGIGELFTGLARAFKEISQQTVNIGSLGGIIKFLVTTELIIYPIRRLVSALLGLLTNVDASVLAASGTFIRGIAEALVGISKTFAEAKYITPDLGTIIKTLFVFGRIIAPIKDVAKILAQLPKGADFAGAGDYVNAVSKFIEKLFTTFSQSEYVKDGGQAANLKKTVNSIVDVLKALKVPKGAFDGASELVKFIDNFDKIQNIGTLFKSLAEGVQALDGVDAKNISPAFEALGAGLITFSKAVNQLDDKEVKRLIQLGEAFKNLPVDSLSKSLDIGKEPAKNLGEVRDISDDVANGIGKANIRAAIFHTIMSGIGSVISLLDPRRPIELLIEGFSKASALVDDFKQKLYSALDAVKQLGQNIRGFGNSIVSNFGVQNITNTDFFKSTVDFDKLGNSLEVFGGLTKEQRKEAEDFANVLGKDYPLSANEALKSTLDLVKAGQDLEATRFILPAAADLASLSDSGSIENATAFIIQATAAFDQFNTTTAGSFDNAATAVNIISAAADSTTASVEGLAEGLANVGPVANTFGLTLEDTTAALALFADGGITGAEAGTQLKSILTSLTSKEATKELKRLGISIADTAGNIRPFNDILNDIQKKFTQTGTNVSYVTKKLAGPDAERLKLAQNALAAATRQQFLIGNDLNATGLGKNADKKLEEAKQIADNATAIITEITGSSQETERIVRNIKRTELQNAESLKKIAGSYGQSGLAILLAQGTDGLKNFEEQMRAVEPASVRARKALDNISGDVIQLQGSVETLGTKALLPLLEKFFRPLVQLARFVVDSILGMNEGFLEFITTAVTLAASLATVVGTITAVIGALIQLGGASAGLATFLYLGTKTITIGLVTGFAGIAAGIATLAAGLVIITPLIAAITSGFETLYTIFTENKGDAAGQLQNLANNVSGALNQVADAVNKILRVVNLVITGGNITNLDNLGKGIASFLNSVALAVTKFRTSGIGKTLLDIGNIFDGFYRTLSLVSDKQSASDLVLGSLEFDTENLGSAQRAQRKIKQAQDAIVKNYAQFILDLSKNNKFLQGIIGENATIEDVQKYFNRIFEVGGKVRAGISNVFGSIGRAFETAKGVFDQKGLGAALNTFFDQLRNNLDDSLGDLAGVVLDALRDLFGFDSGDLAQVFNVQGFAAGISKLFQKALVEVRKFLLTNRGGIKGLLTFVFENIFLGGLNLAKTIANALGLKDVAGAIDQVVQTLKNIFGGLIDTIFNLLAGQDLKTALLNAFGPGIQPFLDLVSELGRAVTDIVSFFGKIAEAIFGKPKVAQAGDKPFLASLFEGIVQGLTGFLEFLNNNFLDYLAKGDIGGLLTNIANQLATAIQGLDLPSKFAQAAQSILNGLVTALKNAFLTIGDVLGFDAQGFLDKISSAMKTAVDALGPNTTVFDVVVTAVQALLVTSLDGIFTGIGELLNFDTSPIIDKINTSLQGLVDAVRNVFGGADGTSVFDDISTIIDKLRLALEALFKLFSSSDADKAKTNISPLATVLQALVHVLGGIVSTTIDTLKDFVTGIGTMIDQFAKLDPFTLLVLLPTLAVSIGSISAAVLGFSGGGAILAAIGSGLTAMAVGVSALLTPILTIAFPLVVFIQLLRSVIQNMDGLQKSIQFLKEGKIGEGLIQGIKNFLNIFTDLGFNLLNILGINEIFGQTRDELKRTANIITFYMGLAFNNLGRLLRVNIIDPIEKFINVTVPLLGSEFERIQLQTQATLGTPGAQTKLKAFNEAGSIAGLYAPEGLGFDSRLSTGASGFYDQLISDIGAGGSDAQNRLSLELQKNFDLIFNRALLDYANTAGQDPTVKDAVLDNMVTLFTFGGQNEEFLARALQSGDPTLFGEYLVALSKSGNLSTPEQQAALQAALVQSITDSLDYTSLDSVQASLDTLNFTIDSFTALGLDTTQLVALRDSIQGQIDAFLASGDPVTTDVPVDATLKPTITNPDAPGGAVPPEGKPVDQTIPVRPNYKILDAADAGQIAPGPAQKVGTATQGVTGPAATPFDSSSLGNPEAVSQFNQTVLDLTTNVQTLGEKLNGLSSTQQLVTTILGAISTTITTFRDSSILAFDAVNASAAELSTKTQSLQDKMTQLLAVAVPGLAAFGVTASFALASVSFQFFAMQSAADYAVTFVIKKIQDLTSKLLDAADAAKMAADGMSGLGLTGSPGGGAGLGPGRAGGGDIWAGQLFPFLEKGRPELVSIGNDTYLASPGPGRVTPLDSLPRGSGSSYSGSSGGGVMIQQGGISVTVNAQTGADARDIAIQTAREVQRLRDNQNKKLSTTLRENHR